MAVVREARTHRDALDHLDGKTQPTLLATADTLDELGSDQRLGAILETKQEQDLLGARSALGVRHRCT